MAVADKRELNEQLGRSHGSFELVVSPVILGAGGWWIDTKVGSAPWFMIGAVVFGVAGAVTKLYLDYRMRMGQLAESAREGREARSAEHAAGRAEAAAQRAAFEQALLDEAARAESRLDHESVA